ncbi:MAG TPA: hypothetical protein VHR39_12245 [Propionibacteriaceae bacterium]|nr:hypothetical protein [Propionibacteriaceae bacterium]
MVDADGPGAVVVHRSPTLDDPATAEAVAAAVRLALRHERLQHEQRQQLAELEASRARIVAATDPERERTAMQLRGDVGVSLEFAQSEVSSVRKALRDPVLVETLDIVVSELATAQREIVQLVAGVPPAGNCAAAAREATNGTPARYTDETAFAVLSSLDPSGCVATSVNVPAGKFFSHQRPGPNQPLGAP